MNEERIVILYVDALALRVRGNRKVVSVPVLGALGVRADGQKVVLDLETLTSESTTAWSGFLESL
ncbi:MAG: IS256 family transposase, partial [Nitrospiraceae bacterium]